MLRGSREAVGRITRVERRSRCVPMDGVKEKGYK